MGFYKTVEQLNKTYPFHMPGHKRNTAFIPENLLNFDITEIPGADNLMRSEGIILEMEKEFARLNKAEKSYISVNGSSGGIMAAIMACCCDGDNILMGRNSHKSAYSALILSGAKPVYIYPQITKYNLCGGFEDFMVEGILNFEENIRAVFITSPTYEGFTTDIRKIANIVHQRGAILIVDESHGAHFRLSDRFPETAMECGADISIQSLHKTLPALGQSSIINVNSSLIDPEIVKEKLNMIQTSSPSYMMMSVMDYQKDLLEKNPRLVEDYVFRLENFRKNVSGLKTLELLGENLVKKYSIKDYDIGKLVFYINSSFSGKELEIMLRDEYNIQIELGGLNHIIAMTSVADTAEGFERLENALIDIDKRFEYVANKTVKIPLPTISKPIISPRKACSMQKTTVHISKSLGKLCGEFIVPFPPDVPLMIPGEVVTENMMDMLTIYLNTGINVIGAENGFIKIIEM